MRILYDQLAQVAEKRNDPSFSYATWHMNQRRLHILLEELRACRGDTCLEVGCGEGFFTNALADKFRKVIGLDFSPGMISEARQHVPRSRSTNVYFIVGDAEHLPLPSKSFDCVVAINLFLHLFRPEVAVPDIARVVRQDGLVLIETLNKHSPLLLFRKVGELLVEKINSSGWAKTTNKLFKLYSGARYRSYSDDDMQRLVEKQPLATKKVRRYLLVGTQFPRLLVRLAGVLEPVMEKSAFSRMTLMSLYVYVKK